MKINWKKVSYFLSPFDFIKCADCEFDGKSDPYCKPPLGICICNHDKCIKEQTKIECGK